MGGGGAVWCSGGHLVWQPGSRAVSVYLSTDCAAKAAFGRRELAVATVYKNVWFELPLDCDSNNRSLLTTRAS